MPLKMQQELATHANSLNPIIAWKMALIALPMVQVIETEAGEIRQFNRGSRIITNTEHMDLNPLLCEIIQPEVDSLMSNDCVGAQDCIVQSFPRHSESQTVGSALTN